MSTNIYRYEVRVRWKHSDKKQELKKTTPADDRNARWVCLECHYIYDPAKGDPRNGIPPGTPWEKVPDTWRCPECKILKAKKGVFRRLED